ncbi:MULTISPECIES: acyl-CoA dehydrogenase family protein [Pseudomonas]|uniref:acyl-CoA dehydrogenase family protein n=1 Tax=Pseudomonas nitroreducens TaxID=46680 RepID=UPI001E4C603A|nr:MULTISPECIES: acyl-CoA dehydrogenase family protein [Pseudomonas]MCE4071514.1 acyl-CoA/acyl-ACP dehydrogenase [Pseudomonas nitritireducens]MCE4081290.1 acyl-CoA/acyl-ACP dehydrogenase [Pseudomonas nitroreducens]
MDFALTETQSGLRDLAARIFSEQATQDRLRTLDSKGYFDSALWQQLADSGLLGITLNENEGGVGEDFETLCVLLEEAGRHVAPLPLLEVLVGGVLALQGLPRAPWQAQVFAALSRGEVVLCGAPYEPGKRAPLASTAVAQSQGDGWKLRGSKHLVAAADLPGKCWTLARDEEGLGLYLFDLQDGGVHRERQVDTTGAYLYRLELEDVPAQRLAGPEETKQFIERSQLYGLAASSALAVGVCSEMTRMAAAYTSEREQFGKPIATFQAVSHRLADCYIDTEALRVLSQQAVCRLNQGGVSAEAREAVLVAKIFASEALHRVSHGTQQVHGGTGVDRDYPLFRYCLLAKKLELHIASQGELLQQLGADLAA